ncbi:MAG: M48 family metallopeptidase [Cyanobacteria bacterium P01_H01_bin.121]
MSIELPPGTADYSDRNVEATNRQLGTIILGFGSVLVIVLLVLNILLNQLVWLIPVSVEQQLGRLVVPVFEAQADPSPTQDALNQLLKHLEANLPPKSLENRDYQVLYIPEDTVNALAIPGDRIVIYQGLLADMDSENELAMVLGHELGHFANRDHLRGLGRAVLLQIVFTSLFGDLGSLGAIAVSGAETLTTAQFSQRQEAKADAFGLKLLDRTYGQVYGATDFFAELAKQPGRGLDFLSTHPDPQKRVRNLEKLIRKENYSIGEPTPLPPALQPGDLSS